MKCDRIIFTNSTLFNIADRVQFVGALMGLGGISIMAIGKILEACWSDSIIPTDKSGSAEAFDSAYRRAMNK